LLLISNYIRSNIFKSEFAKNVLTLMTGTAISQAIPIALTPIFTRIYTPNDFGVFSLFLAITSILGVIANGQYEHAIVLPKSDEDALNLVALGLIITAIFSGILFVTVFFFNSQIIELLGNKEIGNLLFLVPLSMLLIGIYNSLNFFNIRKGEFKNISTSLVSKSIGLSLSQVLIGLFTLGPLGLFVGQIISYLTGNMILFKTLKEANKILVISKNNIKKQAKSYKKFPFFLLPSTLLNSVNLNIINLFIPSLFSITTLGFYSLSQRIIGIPLTLIGNSFNQVYLQKASQTLIEIGSTEIIFLKSLKKLVLISFPVFLILFFTVETLFSSIFGLEWRIAGTYAKCLIPLAAARFLSSSLSNTLIIHQKLQYSSIINFLLMVTTIFVFLYSDFIQNSFLETLILYVSIVSIEYLMFIFLYWRVSK